jgi:acetylornithine deacetylase/succinyl-diaminopimelate desuccinylase-like protein
MISSTSPIFEFLLVNSICLNQAGTGYAIIAETFETGLCFGEADWLLGIKGKRSDDMISWQEYLIQHRQRILDELMEFLRFPSISALPEHRPDVDRAAQWLEARLKAAGMEAVRIMPTGAHPLVYGEWLRAPGKPTLLIYGHFDTQPVDPLNLWDSPPFDPVIKNGRIYARGATDDKGNLFIPVIVAEAMLKTSGKLPVNLKFLLEGQEEIGSPQLSDFIAKHRELLSCDMVLSADGGQWDEDQPAVVLGTRGLAAVFIDVQGPDHDLHSGTYGGTIANPLHALVQILNSLHDPNGRITIAGFYDKVRRLSDAERAQMAKVPFVEAEYLWETGASSIFGEPGFTTHERAWARPTLEINGLYGGFQGEGLKTVLPSQAHAKISCRLVADQDPVQIAELVAKHINKAAPPGVKVTIGNRGSGSFPYLIPGDHRGLGVAASVLKDLYGKEPYKIRSGGTIPANAMFLEHLRAYTIVFGFGLEDERLHSPNEFFRLSSFARGQKAYGMLLERLGGVA